MRFRSILILVVALMLFGVSKAAENQPQKWYWAWREKTQELFAYTADGQVNKILEGVPVDQIWLSGENMAIALVLDEKQYSFYKLTSTEAIPIKATFDTSVNQGAYSNWFNFHVLSGRYFLVYYSIPSILILIDLNKEGAFLLEDYPTAYTGFAFHNESFWFLTSPDSGDTQTFWNVWEHRLDTGKERILYKQEKPFPAATAEHLQCSINPPNDQRLCWLATQHDPSPRIDIWLINADGFTIHKEIDQPPTVDSVWGGCVSDHLDNQWLCASHINYNDNHSETNIWIMYRDGRSQIIATKSGSGINRWTVDFSNDHFVVIDNLCADNCSVEVYKLGITEPIVYAIKSEYSELFDQMRLNGVDVLDNALLLYANDGAYYLNRNGTMTSLGEFFCCPHLDSLAPDYKWIVLFNKATKATQVWNLDKGSIEFKFLLGWVWGVTYFERGFAIKSTHLSPVYIYLFSTKKSVRIYDESSLYVLDILPNDTFLIDAQSDENNHKRGIFRYDPVTGKYTLLLADAHDETGKPK